MCSVVCVTPGLRGPGNAAPVSSSLRVPGNVVFLIVSFFTGITLVFFNCSNSYFSLLLYLVMYFYCVFISH